MLCGRHVVKSSAAIIHSTNAGPPCGSLFSAPGAHCSSYAAQLQHPAPTPQAVYLATPFISVQVATAPSGGRHCKLHDSLTAVSSEVQALSCSGPEESKAVREHNDRAVHSSQVPLLLALHRRQIVRHHLRSSVTCWMETCFADTKPSGPLNVNCGHAETSDQLLMKHTPTSIPSSRPREPAAQRECLHWREHARGC
jgi:hypothetical protein